MAAKSSGSDRHPLDPQGLHHNAPRYVVVELRHDSGVAIGRRFQDSADARLPAQPLNDALERFGARYVRPLFADLPAATRRLRATEPGDTHDEDDFSDYAQAGFAQIVPRADEDCEALVQELRSHDAVAQAYTELRTIPAGKVSVALESPGAKKRGFEAAQAYLGSAPGGINAYYAWAQPGGNGAAPKKGKRRGHRVRICDIEGNWDLRHVELPRGIEKISGERMNRKLVGSVAGVQSWKNHGTAVLGLLVGQPKLFGAVGIANGARALVQAQLFRGMKDRTPRQYTDNMARAIRKAADCLGKGDVILLELQAFTGKHDPHPNAYVPAQVSPAVFKAIRHAVDKGITVVEAAANNNLDLDQLDHELAHEDSGAIVVGAGVPPTNYFVSDDYFGWGEVAIEPAPYTEIGVPRTRLWFSNYGSIVNLQGWGMHVATLGYGDAHGGARHQVTLTFSGTSSASAIIAGVAACMQGRAWAVRGEPLDPIEMREILVRTGTPQEYSPASPIAKWIGPQPDLARAFDLI